ncbi:hypothetical protein [Mycobacterium sp. 96-892]|uniref:hypothetical protein n=1 Tax=Mycobacterium sp. 96-892 TaxID=1855664 RepID=UPI001116EA2B|nr:hypothetical protein [Mycobacterium sp. 96-892]
MLVAILFISSFVVAVIYGATAWNWFFASIALLAGVFMLPSALSRVAEPQGRVFVDAGKHTRPGDRLVPSQTARRSWLYWVVLVVAGLMALAAVADLWAAPTRSAHWVSLAWWLWVGLDRAELVDGWRRVRGASSKA